jgi:hypothetical protein
MAIAKAKQSLSIVRASDFVERAFQLVDESGEKEQE